MRISITLRYNLLHTLQTWLPTRHGNEQMQVELATTRATLYVNFNLLC